MKRVGLFALLLSAASTAFGFSPPSSEAASSLFAEDAIVYDYRGIVSLGNCSGSLVRFEDSLPDDKGLILTNGHCVRIIQPGTALADRFSFKSFTILAADASSLGRVRASRLVYATMTGTDMALYQLRDSYADILERFDIEALTISSERAFVNDEIEILSGYWKRGYSCSIESTVHQLQEGDHLMEDSMRYSRPGWEVIGGTSGSPVLLAGTRTVIGVNNTGNVSGQRCTVNNPCEIDENGDVLFEKGYNYAQQINDIYSCRTETGAFDFQLESCSLTRP